ncbi:MAG: class I SAM-dependent methyltransferase [Acidobacteriaceae bacterium]|nr:class I SAM-dependent methyltransferase [Acidobacteriaceae bacterium]
MNPLAPIEEIMRRHDSTCTVEEFHTVVNVVFHEFEAEIYDVVHRDMWESLPAQVSLLASDCLHSGAIAGDLRLLDVGCGTGLASDCVLKSPLGPKVASVHLLDMSPTMLRKAQSRAGNWNIPVTSNEGTVETLRAEQQFDLIVTCSVLHHIPDLAAFLRNIRQVQAPDGVFIHLQDPNGDYLKDEELQKRTAELSKTIFPEWISRLAPKRVLGRVYREITGKQGQDYVSRTNRELLRRGVVQSPLTTKEIFSITDIHVQDGAGISIRRMMEWMPDYELISQRAYAFFGRLASTLPPEWKSREEELSAQRALNGMHISAAWRLSHPGTF